MRLRPIALLLATGLATLTAQACTLTMGYRSEARPPLMAEAPDHRGLYLDLYRTVAQRLGCQLKVERLPKLRIVEALKRGEVDFYPGMDFDEDRDTYLLFMDNGLPGGLVGISRPDLPEVTHLRQLAGRRLLRHRGQPNYLEDLSPTERAGITEVKVVSAALERGVEMLLRDRGDFYVYARMSVDYVIRTHPEWRAQLKVHPQCCGEEVSYHAAFSQASPHVQLTANPAYKPGKPLGPDHQRVVAQSGCLAHRFAQELQRMVRSGEVRRLYAQYHATEP